MVPADGPVRFCSDRLSSQRGRHHTSRRHCRPTAQSRIQPNARCIGWINIARPAARQWFAKQTMRGAIRVVDHSALPSGASIMQNLFQRIEDKGSFGRPRHSPSDDAISECVDDKSDIHKALPCRHVDKIIVHCPWNNGRKWLAPYRSSYGKRFR